MPTIRSTLRKLSDGEHNCVVIFLNELKKVLQRLLSRNNEGCMEWVEENKEELKSYGITKHTIPEQPDRLLLRINASKFCRKAELPAVPQMLEERPKNRQAPLLHRVPLLCWFEGPILPNLTYSHLCGNRGCMNIFEHGTFEDYTYNCTRDGCEPGRCVHLPPCILPGAEARRSMHPGQPTYAASIPQAQMIEGVVPTGGEVPGWRCERLEKRAAEHRRRQRCTCGAKRVHSEDCPNYREQSAHAKYLFATRHDECICQHRAKFQRHDEKCPHNRRFHEEATPARKSHRTEPSTIPKNFKEE